MRNYLKLLITGTILLLYMDARGWAALPQSDGPDDRITITEAECTAAKAGTEISPSLIGEPVSAVTIAAPRWIAATASMPVHCSIDGAMAPIDRSPTAEAIQFRVLLPASWNRRAAQIGGGGTNGVIPNLTGQPFQRGFAVYGSDSGHQINDPGWNVNDEALRNFGYMQMKKTRDAAMVLMQRIYGERARFNYYVGNSQGGREALTVAQRYPADYDGISATVPVVSLSSLQVAPTLIHIHEKPLANWVPTTKVNAIQGEFMRQCDKLDGLADGIINNYMACRAIFDVRQGAPNRQPWAAKRCPGNIDPNPADTTAAACLTEAQISTLHLTYSRYPFKTPLANGATTFGMWVPNTDPSGNGLLQTARLRGQEGAAVDAPMFSHLSVPGVTGRLMRNLNGNPLDYVDTPELLERWQALSEILDSTNPDLSAFHRRGGKMIVVIGTNDTLASPGAQLDYFQSIIDKMSRNTVDEFARFFVMPQARPWVERNQSHRGWRRQNDGRGPYSQHVRSFRCSRRLGREADGPR